MKTFVPSLISLIFLAYASGAAAAVYKHIADDGSVFYSDKPLKNEDKKYESEKLMEFKAPKPDAKSATPATQQPTTNRPHLGGTSDEVPHPATKQAQRYESIEFSSLQDGASVRSNDGNITLQVSLKPALQTSFNHQLVIVMDGSQTQQSGTSSATFENVDRGAHQFSAQVRDEKGNTLLETGPITLYVQRFSAIRANTAH